MAQNKLSVPDGHAPQKKNWIGWCIISFFCTLLIALVCAGIKGLFPFGDTSVYYNDLFAEFSVFLTELWQKVHTGGSLLYSWRTALGGPFFGNLFYYASSPLNLLVLLGKEESIPDMITGLIFFRQAMSAFLMCLFLCKRRRGGASFASAVCGILYGCCGWFCGCFFITIWHDVFMLTPLLLWGIERIIDDWRPRLFFFVFTVMLFSNFYITYFVAVFAVVYWIGYYFGHYSFSEDRMSVPCPGIGGFLRTRFFRAGTMFALSAVLSVLCLSVVFVPLLLQLSRTENNVDVTSRAAFFSNITQQIAALFSGAEFKTTKYVQYPAIYTGVLAVVGVPLFFFVKNVNRREKTACAAMLAFLTLSFNVPFLDYVWHGFRLPTNVSFREAWFFSVVLVIMLHQMLSGISELPAKSFLSFAGGATVIIVCAIVEMTIRGEKDRMIGASDVIVTAALFLVFAGMLVLMRYGKKEQVTAAVAFVFLFTLIDGSYTFVSNLNMLNMTKSEIAEEKATVGRLFEKINDDSLFYRAERSTSLFVNDGAAFGYNGIRQTSSMTAADTFTFLNRMGLDSNRSNFAGYHMQTPVFNSIFGVKYLLERMDYADYIGFSYLACAGDSYRIADSLKRYSIYRFGNALSLMYVPCRSLIDWAADGETPFDNQNAFYAAAAGLPENALIPCDEDAVLQESREGERVTPLGGHCYQIERVEGVETTTDPAAVFTIKARKSGMVYVYAENVESENTSVLICVNEGPFFSSQSTLFCGAVYLAEKDEEIKLEVRMGTGADAVIAFRAFQLDEKIFSEQYEAIAAGGTAELTAFSDASFSGEIEIAENDRCICVTVPYDPGWTVTMDGKELSQNDFSLIGGAFYCIPAEKGSHTLRFDYHLPGLGMGATLSCFALLGSTGGDVLLRRKRRKADTPTVVDDK